MNRIHEQLYFCTFKHSVDLLYFLQQTLLHSGYGCAFAKCSSKPNDALFFGALPFSLSLCKITGFYSLLCSFLFFTLRVESDFLYFIRFIRFICFCFIKLRFYLLPQIFTVIYIFLSEIQIGLDRIY